jgi:hypothetical protein
MSWNQALDMVCKFSLSRPPYFASKYPTIIPFLQLADACSSHFNTAHFMNPDFQPEEWCPDGEYSTGNKGRHKSHSS